MRPNEYKMIAVPPDLQRRAKLMSVRMDITIIELVRRGLDLIEAQNELPHPHDGTPVPLVYQDQSK